MVKFQSWLWSIYTAFLCEVLEDLSDYDAHIRTTALRVLMGLVCVESEMKDEPTAVFGNETFVRVVRSLVLNPRQVFVGEYMNAYSDVQFHVVGLSLATFLRLPMRSSRTSSMSWRASATSSNRSPSPRLSLRARLPPLWTNATLLPCAETSFSSFHR
jgi:hypothetical protein